MEVPQDHYTEEYYLQNCGGFREFNASGGTELPRRLKKALDFAQIEPGMRTLDVGVGRGEVLLNCALAGAEAYGLDYASASIKLAREITKDRENARLVQANSTRFPFRSDFFDRMLFLDIVEHLTPSQLDSMYSEAKRTLSPGGFMVIHTAPNRWAMDVGHPIRRALNNAAVPFSGKWPLKRLVPHAISPLSPDGREMMGEYKGLHVNEQTYFSLKRQLERCGFEADVFLEHEYENVGRFGKLTQLWPLSDRWPLKLIFAIHIWAICRPR